MDFDGVHRHEQLTRDLLVGHAGGRELGGSLGIAVLLFLQTRFQDTAYVGLASSVTLANQNVAHAVQQDGITPIQLWSMVTTNATVISYDMVLRLCGIVFALSIPVVLLLRTKPRSGEPIEVTLE